MRRHATSDCALPKAVPGLTSLIAPHAESGGGPQVDVRERIGQCEALTSEGDAPGALIDLLFLRKQIGAAAEPLMAALSSAVEACGGDHPRSRNAILDVLRGTESADVLDACMHALIMLGDVATLKSLSADEIMVDPCYFHLGFEDYVDHCLMLAATQGRDVALCQVELEGARFEGFGIMGAYFTLNRAEGDSAAPRIPMQRRADLGTPVFAVVHDRRNDRYLATLERADRVVAVDPRSLRSQHSLESPEPGVRGICVHEELNRGFFCAESGDVAFSFDLGDLRLRRKIEGFPKRPERIYLHAPTNTMVVGTLGEMILFPNQTIDATGSSAADAAPRQSIGKTIVLVDAESESIVRTLPTGRRPTAVAISAGVVEAGNFFDNTVIVYPRHQLDDPAIVDFARVPDGRFEFKLFDKHVQREVAVSKTLRPRLVDGAAIAERRGWIMLTGYDASIVTVVDITANKPISVIPVQNRPFDIVIDEDERYAFVSCHGSDVASVIDLETQSEVLLLETGPRPVDMTLAAGQLLIADSAGFCIYDLDCLPL